MVQMTEGERQGARITELFGQACRYLQRPCRSKDKRSMEVGKGGEQATIQKTDIHESDGFLTRRRQGIDLLKGLVDPYAAVLRLIELHVCSCRIQPSMQCDKGEIGLLRQLDGICKGGEGFLRMILEGMENAEIVQERCGEYRRGRAFGQFIGLRQMCRGCVQLACHQIDMAQLRQDRCPPQSIRFILRECRGEFRKLERLSGVAKR